MSDSSHILELMQADVFGVLDEVLPLKTANLVLDGDGDLDGKVERALASLTVRNGNDKRGLAIVVLRPEVAEATENLPGPPLMIKIEVQVIEQVLFNRDPVRGSMIRANQAALHVLASLHQRSIGSCLLFAKKDPIHSLPVIPGHVSSGVTLYAYANVSVMPRTPGVEPYQSNKTPGPGKLIELWCSDTAATIRYTIDGSYPGSLAIPYTAPFDMPDVGTLVRCSALNPAIGPSDVLEFTVT